MVVVLEEDIIEEEVEIEESESLMNHESSLLDHDINRGFTMEEAHQRVQPNVNRPTVSSIVQTFRRKNENYRTAQQPRAGGRAAVFNHQQ